MRLCVSLFRALSVRAVVATVLACGLTGLSHAGANTSAITSEIVNFRSNGVVLSGTVTMPANPTAAVVVVNGAGREGQLLSLATYLATNGIAVLTYDKRGIGLSGGVYVGPEVGTNNVEPANLSLLASDASAALASLVNRKSIRNMPVGFFGFSQAGWIIPMAARSNRAAQFMVIVSGPVVTTREQLRFQFFSESEGRATFWNTHTEAQAREHIRNDPDRFPFTDTDPLDTLEGLSIPGLWLFGGNDVLVPVALSLERLSTLTAKGKPFESLVYADGDHVLLMTRSDAIDTAISWIRKTTNQMRSRAN